MRTLASRPLNAACARIDVHPATDQVNRRVLPLAENREALAAGRAATSSSSAERSAARFVECGSDDLELLVEVMLGTAAPASRQRSQALGRVMTLVALAGERVGVGVKEGVAILGDEKKQEPVDEPQRD